MAIPNMLTDLYVWLPHGSVFGSHSCAHRSILGCTEHARGCTEAATLPYKWLPNTSTVYPQRTADWKEEQANKHIFYAAAKKHKGMQAHTRILDRRRGCSIEHCGSSIGILIGCSVFSCLLLMLRAAPLYGWLDEIYDVARTHRAAAAWLYALQASHQPRSSC